MIRTACAWCSREARPEEFFCCRCGGRIQQESAEERLLYRLQMIRRLIRYRAMDWASAAASIVFQANDAKALLDAEAGLAAQCQASLDWLEAELQVHDRAASLPWRIQVVAACGPLFPEGKCESLHRLLQALKKLMAAFSSGEQTLATHTAVPPEKLQAWLAAVSKQLAIRVDEAKSYIAATPQFWPRLAAALDPRPTDKLPIFMEFGAGVEGFRTNDLAAAEAHFQAVVSVDPGNVAALERLAMVYLRLDQAQQAIPLLRKAIDAGTADANTYNSYAWYLCTAAQASESDHELALSAARRAVELAPVGAYWDTLAEVLYKLGDLPGAFAATREAIRDNPERAVYRERMERLCEEAAVDFFDVALRGDSGISLADPTDSGLALEAPPDLGGDDDSLVSGEDDYCVAVGGAEVLAAAPPRESDLTGMGTRAKTDDEFLLTPLEEPADEEEAEGSQVIALDSEGERGPRMLCDMGPCADVCPPMDIAGGLGMASAAPSPLSDQVQFSLTGPAIMAPANYYVIEVWAHLPKDRDEVAKCARETQGAKEIQIKSKMGVKIPRGTLLTVSVAIHGLVVSDPEETIVWEGEIANASFPVEVPPDAKIGTYAGIVTIAAERVPLAKIHFVVKVGQEESRLAQFAAPARRYRSAFASYASEDRDQVLGRLQGIQKVIPDMDIFLDVASLRSGQQWWNQIVEEITCRDVFYLFWSKHAQSSPYVEREWRTALDRKGIQCIDPIPLAPPDAVPPPPELADQLHFNDWVLAYMRGKGD